MFDNDAEFLLVQPNDPDPDPELMPGHHERSIDAVRIYRRKVQRMIRSAFVGMVALCGCAGAVKDINDLNNGKAAPPFYGTLIFSAMLFALRDKARYNQLLGELQDCAQAEPQKLHETLQQRFRDTENLEMKTILQRMSLACRLPPLLPVQEQEEMPGEERDELLQILEEIDCDNALARAHFRVDNEHGLPRANIQPPFGHG